MFLKYWEMGYSVLPLKKSSKIPVYGAGDGWSRWAKEVQPQKLIESFEEHYPVNQGYGIGVILGRQSGIMAIDVDHEEPDIIRLLKPSPVVRLGRPGRHGVMFYRYTEGVRNRKLEYVKAEPDGTQRKIGTQLFATTGYVVLPPSIHPDTLLPYRWATPDTLESMSKEDLPDLTDIDLLPLHEFYESRPRVIHPKEAKTGPGGRNNKLTEVATAISGKYPTDEAGIRELYEYDKAHFNPPLFSDPTENNTIKLVKSEADALENAKRFYLSVKKSNIANGVIANIQVLDEKSALQIESKKIVMKPLPELPGYMEVIRNEILKNSVVPNRTFATAGVIALFSVLCSTRYTLKGNRPATFSLILGETGSGKDSIRSFLYSVLNSEHLAKYNLLGLQNYVSAPATVLGLPRQRTRLDVVDEFSSFIKAAANPASSHKREVMTELMQILTLNTGFYAGIKAISRQESGACFAPSVSLLGLVQPGTFVEHANKDMLEAGFFSRFLYFYDEPPESGKYTLNRAALLSADRGYPLTLAAIKELFPRLDSFDTSDLISPEKAIPTFTEMHLDHKLEDAYMDGIEHFLEMGGKDGVRRALYSRAGQNMGKLCIQFAAACGREHIERSDIDCAVELLSSSIGNSLMLLGEATSPHYRAKMHDRFVSYIAKRGSVSSRQVIDMFKGETALRKSILADCIESGVVAIEQKGQRLTYHYVGHGV